MKRMFNSGQKNKSPTYIYNDIKFISGSDKNFRVDDILKNNEVKPYSTNNSNGKKNIAIEDYASKPSNIRNAPKRSVPLANFSRQTRDRIIVGATDLSKTTIGALREFCKNTTAHGFNHVVEPKSPVLIRIFWLLATLICLFAMANVVMQATTNAFVTRRTFTEVEYTDNQAEGLLIPDITFCDKAGFWRSKMEAHDVSTQMGSYILIALRGASIASTTFLSSASAMVTQKIDLNMYLMQKNTTLRQLIFDISPTCNDIVYECSNPERELHTIDCCNELFRPVMTSLGVCYTTIGNNYTHYRQRLAGFSGGLKIIFRNDMHEYMRYSEHILSAIMVSETGVQVSLTMSPVSMPTVAAVADGIGVAPGTAASIAMETNILDKTETYSSLWPWSATNCVTDEEISKMTEEEIARTGNNLYWTIQYRDCDLQLAHCISIPFSLESDKGIDDCMPYDLIKLQQSNNLQEEYEECLTEKRAQYPSTHLCSVVTINQQLSYTNFDVNRVENNTSVTEYLVPSMVTIYHKALGRTIYFQRLPTFQSWFTDLGGQMGLFLGASLITIIELFFTVSFVIKKSIVHIYMKIKSKLNTCMKIRKKDETKENTKSDLINALEAYKF